MGMGEPLLNYDPVIQSIHVLRDRNGLNFPTDGITISTIGPIPQLKKLREEHIKIQLTLSLHATTQKQRDTLIPSMRNSRIESVIESVLSYSERHNRKVTIAYLVFPGYNDSERDADRLARWFGGQNVLINLLQYNEIENLQMKRPSKEQLVVFKKMLEYRGLNVLLRESHGRKISAACGQLVSSKNKKRTNYKK
jgi:23S rRNA (adenine2503-C2)-methyltransferase